jgi:hypothetical protein
VPSGVRENGTAPGPVVIGESREDATAAFGPTWDGFFVTTYAEQADEVDLGAVTALGLAAGSGFEGAFETALARLEHEPGFVLEVELAAGTAALVHDRLAAAGLHITGVHTAHDRVVVRIGTAAGVASEPAATAAPAAPRAPAAGPVRPVAPTPPAGWRERLRAGGRARLAVVAALAVVLGIALAVAALAAGVDGAVVVLVAAALLGEAVLAVLVRRAVLAANRAADRPLPDPRPLLLRNRRMLDKRTARILARLREVQGDTAHSRTELVALRRYVEAVAEEQARLRARLDRSGVPDLPRDVEESG